MNAEKEVALLINVDKDRRMTVEAKGLYLPDAIQLCLGAIEALCKQTLSRNTDKNLAKSLEEDMYNMINLGASTLLNRLFPEIDMRPDITVDAIMEAENKLVDQKGEEYAKAYKESAQSEIDIYEHNLAKANLIAAGMNREQKRKAGIRNKK